MLKIGVKIDEVRIDGEVPIKEILSTFIDSYGGMFIMELRNRYFEHIKESKENLKGILIKKQGFLTLE
jgi:hypothetical protein